MQEKLTNSTSFKKFQFMLSLINNIVMLEAIFFQLTKLIFTQLNYRKNIIEI